ncbi:MAG: 50S ribosomal protein L11 methyltransferase [Bdellovibrionales bacterium]
MEQGSLACLFSKTGQEADYTKWWIEQTTYRKDEMLDTQGFNIFVPAKVFAPDPRVTRSVSLFMENAKDMTGMRVLDIGTGTGILALHAVWEGAREVVATEIDQAALAAARRNFSAYAVGDKVKLVEQGVLDCSWGRFDRIMMNIIFSTPQLTQEQTSALAQSTLSIHRDLFTKLDVLMTATGKCCLGFASFGDIEGLEKELVNLQSRLPVALTCKSERRFDVNWYYLELSRPPTLSL